MTNEDKIDNVDKIDEIDNVEDNDKIDSKDVDKQVNPYISPDDLAKMFDEQIEAYKKMIEEKEKKYPIVEWRSIFLRLFPKDQILFDFFLSKMKFVKSNPYSHIPFAAVSFSPSMHKFVLFWNDLNMREIYHDNGEEKIRGIIKHEIYHIMLGHVTSRKPSNPKMNKAWNYAADLAINTNIPRNELPEWVLVPGEGHFADFPANKSAEFYYHMLLQKIEEEEQNGEGEGDGEGDSGFDNKSNGGGFKFKDIVAGHDKWEEMNGEAVNASESMKDFMKKQAQAAAKEMFEAGYIEERDSTTRHSNRSNSMPGNIPFNCYKDILEGFHIKSFKIKDLINRLATRAITARSRKCSRKIHNKRFPQFSGVCHKSTTPHVVIAVDQSGSVDDHMVHLFFEVSQKLNKYFKITILPFDTRVNDKHIASFNKGKFNGKHKRSCSGGTDFDEVVKYANDHYSNCDLIIVTDLGASFPVVASKNPLHWVASNRDISGSCDGAFLDHRSADLYEIEIEE